MKKPNPIRSALLRVAAVVVLAGVATLACVNLWTVLKAAWADASSLRARTTVTLWRHGQGPILTKENWEGTRDQLRNALETAPGNADLLEDLAFLHAGRARNIVKLEPGSEAYVLKQALLDQAIVYYRAAIALRPVFPYAWANLALAKHDRDQHDAEFWNAFDRGLQYGKTDAALQPTLVIVAYALWPTLDPQRQQAVSAMVANAKEPLRTTLREKAQREGVVLLN